MSAGHAILVPHLNDVVDQFGLVIKNSPWSLAGIVGIVLEREESKILHAPVLLQIVQESRGPRDTAVSIGPDFDVLVYALERWPA